MTFTELKLAMAIHYADLRGRDWVSRTDRIEGVSRVFAEYVSLFDDSYFPFSIDDVVRIRLALRKNNDTKAKAEVALTHGYRCFWVDRGKGSCSEEAELGHIVAKSRGGELTVANTMIECRRHNNERRDRSIEVYLASATQQELCAPGNISTFCEGESDATRE